MFYRFSSFALTGLIFFGINGAIAQSATSDPASVTVFEEVIVTAQKRPEAISEVPIAIDTISGDEFDDLFVLDTDDFVKLFPNLSLNRSSPINSGFTIRGVGTFIFHLNAQPAVSTYFDEVSHVTPFSGTQGLFDIERVEILRGPQNTLFGRNTTGGAISIISVKPEAGGPTNGYGRFTAGTVGRKDFEGAYGTGLGDDFGIRLAVQSSNRDGWQRNLTTGQRDGEIERLGGRVQLVWEPDDRTRVLTKFQASSSGGRRISQKASGLYDPNGTLTPGVFDCPHLGDTRDNFEYNNGCLVFRPNVPGQADGEFLNLSTSEYRDVLDISSKERDIDVLSGSLNVQHDFERIAVTSITSYEETTVQFAQGNGGLPYDNFSAHQDAEFRAFSQEIRLTSLDTGPLRWTLGGFYSQEDDVMATIVRDNRDPTRGYAIIPSVAIEQDIEVLSGYGQVEFDFLDNFTLTLGGRYTDDSKSGISTARQLAATSTGAPDGEPLPVDQFLALDFIENATADVSTPCPSGVPCRNPTRVSQDLNEFGWRFGLDWRVIDDLLLYTTYARGFKSGAFDMRALAAIRGLADAPAGPEFLDAYELGFKLSHFDGRLNLTGAGFYYIWEDQQAFSAQVNGAPAFLNIPESQSWGLEFSADISPGHGWFVRTGAGYLNTEITDVGTLNGPRVGSPLTNAPEFSLNLLVIKEIPFKDGVLALQGDVSYQSDRETSLNNTPTLQVPETTYVNARLSYRFGRGERFEIAVAGENLTRQTHCSGFLNTTLSHAQDCLPQSDNPFVTASFQVKF